jgi:hypothetical protein
MRIRLLVTATLAGLAVGAALTTPAQAVTKPPVAITGWLQCASGQSTGYLGVSAVSVYSDGTAVITVAGRITPCQLPDPGNAFGVARYYPADAASATPSAVTKARAYAATTAPNPYEVTLQIGPTTAALCLVSGRDIRLDCIALSWPAGAAAPVVTGHIPVTDSRVQVPVFISRNDTGEQHPGCPMCWY